MSFTVVQLVDLEEELSPDNPEIPLCLPLGLPGPLWVILMPSVAAASRTVSSKYPQGRGPGEAVYAARQQVSG